MLVIPSRIYSQPFLKKNCKHRAIKGKNTIYRDSRMTFIFSLALKCNQVKYQ
jgi:hypothetical protein